MNIKFVNPKNFTDDDLPMIVFCSDQSSLFGFITKNVTNGNVNHVMLMHKEELFASQSFDGFKEKSFNHFNSEKNLMYFYSIKDISIYQKQRIMSNINSLLSRQRSWFSYDYSGLIGQLLRIPSLQNPMKQYCSENVISILNKAMDWNIPPRLSPEGLKDWCNNNGKLVKLEGMYIKY